MINVAGHRLGTKELESAAIEVNEVAEAAAVPVVDDVRGKVVEMYIAVKPSVSASDEEVAKKVSAQIERDIGKVARPKNVWVVPDMPKTRSGKIMRRVIAGISNFADVGDVSTLANPEVVDQIRDQVQGAKKARGEDVPAVQDRAGGDRDVRAGVRVRIRARVRGRGHELHSCTAGRLRRRGAVPAPPCVVRAIGIVWPPAKRELRGPAELRAELNGAWAGWRRTGGARGRIPTAPSDARSRSSVARSRKRPSSVTILTKSPLDWT